MSINDNTEETWELVSYNCATCKDSKWKLFLRSDKKNKRTYLVLICSNDKCVETRKKQLGAEPDDAVIWEEFDISGQGYDYFEELEPKDIDNDWVN